MKMKFFVIGLDHDGKEVEILSFQGVRINKIQKDPGDKISGDPVYTIGSANSYQSWSGCSARLYLEDSEGHRVRLENCVKMSITLEVDDLVGPTMNLELI